MVSEVTIEMTSESALSTPTSQEVVIVSLPHCRGWDLLTLHVSMGEINGSVPMSWYLTMFLLKCCARWCPDFTKPLINSS